MNEKLFHFIWKYQYFNKSNLQTVDGEPIILLHGGVLNVNQGPDFLNAKIIIGNTTWVGNVELHIRTTDWDKHQHSNDSNFQSVILHVVWKNDMLTNKNNLPILELQPYTSTLLLQRYEELMNAQSFVPCKSYLPALDDLKWTAWKERLAIERLQRKSNEIVNDLSQANNHWEEVFWWKIAANFGIKVNAEIFQQIAKSISINILAKHKNQIHQLEGLLLGQAGLLNSDFDEDYPAMLKKEYQFYQKKYNLVQVPVKPFFLRMRPANFPTIRLAQLAMFVHSSVHLFSTIKETETVDELKKLLDITANDYWHYHYQLDQPAEYHLKKLGNQMMENIIINTVIPILFAYGSYTKNDAVKEKALKWLYNTAAEKNTITKAWMDLGVSSKTALESQALIELKNNYCKQTKCLDCAVGNVVMKG